MDDRRQVQVAVAGCGYFGRFHALKLAAAQRFRLVGVHDPDAARAALVARDAGEVPVLDWPAVLDQAQAVVIAAPAEHHFSLARAAIMAGRHVLVEKPLAATLAQADALNDLAGQQGVVLQVGHLLRYTPEREAIAARMQQPLYIESTRIAPFKPRGTDVSVVLDLMIHDLDLILSLVDSEIITVDAMGAAVTSAFEDIANARVRFANGCVAMVTASRISYKTERKMRLFSREGYLSADFGARRLVMIGRDHGLPLPGTNGFRRQEVSWQDRDALEAEHAAFAAAILDDAPVLVDGKAGRRALAAALAVGAAMADWRSIATASGLLPTHA